VVIGRNYNLDQDDKVIRDFEDTIFGQDQVWLAGCLPATRV